jgi:anti-sigma factor (TIGR02949 family)
VRCAESLRVQAYFDGEVDAISAAEIERHVEHCAECKALLEDLNMVRAALRKDLGVESAPPELRAKIAQALDREGAAEASQPMVPRPVASRPMAPHPRNRRVRSFWAGALGGVGATAMAASLAMFLIVPRFINPVTDELVNAHVRSLMPAHLIDVVSTDKHTVKPWFAGHADVSPVVADFESQGYRLVGGRVDYLNHQRSAVVVYQHGAHVINVFSWAANGRPLPENATRSGYHLVFWKSGDLAYCAVSDTAQDELNGLVRLLEE